MVQKFVYCLINLAAIRSPSSVEGEVGWREERFLKIEVEARGILISLTLCEEVILP